MNDAPVWTDRLSADEVLEALGGLEHSTRRGNGTHAAPAVDYERSGGDSPLALQSRFQIVDDTQLANAPVQQWLVDELLPVNALATLIGEKATLKTFTALDLTAHVQLGRPWCGREVRQGQCLYVYAEGRTGLSGRLDAWKTYHNVAALGVMFLPQRVTVNDPADVAALLVAIEQTTFPAVTTLALIVVDTLNRNSSGNENSTEDMSAFVRGCDRLREATGATVLVIHHKGHSADGRGRGSSVFESAADTVLVCSRDAERVTIECSKQKDGKDGDDFAAIALEVVPIASSLVLRPSGVTSGQLTGQRLKCLIALHENYTADGGATYKAWLDATSLKESGFNKARSWLKANAYVKADSGKWKVTDAGRMKLGVSSSTNYTATTPRQSEVPVSTPLHQRGVHSTPAVELDAFEGVSR